MFSLSRTFRYRGGVAFSAVSRLNKYIKAKHTAGHWSRPQSLTSLMWHRTELLRAGVHFKMDFFARFLRGRTPDTGKGQPRSALAGHVSLARLREFLNPVQMHAGHDLEPPAGHRADTSA